MYENTMFAGARCAVATLEKFRIEVTYVIDGALYRESYEVEAEDPEHARLKLTQAILKMFRGACSIKVEVLA